MRVTNFFKSRLKTITYILVTGIIVVSSSGSFMVKAFATSSDEITVTYPYYAFIEDENNPWKSVYDALDATGTINYSDSYFEEPSPGGHPKLRAVSYALALAGYENQNDGYPYDPSKPNPKLYDLLNQLGFSDYQSWDLSSEDDGHSMGTTIARKTLASGQELVVVAPRNYNYMTEWLSNFNVGTTGDHAGFSESAGFIVDRFSQYMSSRNLANCKVWVVGYSRGGAVIDLFAKTINENINNYKIAPDDFYVYTFGAPRASTVATGYTNIHDVKDGNDLLLGYVFPELWGFYNTGTYEEIHPADLNIATSVVNIADLTDPATAINILSDNDGLTEEVATVNGRDFMDDWLTFVNKNGLTREYFDSKVKAPLSELMKMYQTRHLDEQSVFTDFLSDTKNGLPFMVAINAFWDLNGGEYGDDLEEALSNFPPYQELVRIIKGTATDADVDDFAAHLANYVGQYSDYQAMLGGDLPISPEELETIRTNLSLLVKALAPLIIADAKYTQETFGEDYSLYYTYSLIKNAEALVIGHIPESMMKNLKDLIPEDEEDIVVPNSGANTYIQQTEIAVSYAEMICEIVTALSIGIFIFIIRPRLLADKN